MNVLRRVWSMHDEHRYDKITRRLAGVSVQDTQAVSLEQALLNGLTRLLRQSGRDPLGIGIIIEYLWRVQLAQHNRLLQHNLSADRQELLGEVLL